MKRGFTLIELLVVIAIIALLSSIVLASLSTARAKARDARRASDTDQIRVALEMFYDINGCLPTTDTPTGCPGATGYSEGNSGGWDYSSIGGFMGFLASSSLISKVPIDPINNTISDVGYATTFAYRYYCYGGAGSYGAVLDYRSEVKGSLVRVLGNPASSPEQANYLCR